MKANTSKDDAAKMDPSASAGATGAASMDPAAAVQAEQVFVAPGLELEADAIVNNDMLLAMGVGVIPIPLVDFLGVTAVQLRMMRRLSELYKTPFSKSDSHALISALVGGALPAYSAMPVASLVRWIPVVGWTLGTASMAILSGSSVSGTPSPPRS